MFNLEKEVLHHSARQIDPAIFQQPADNEVTVPTIHFVEAPSGNDVTVLKVQQPRWRQFVGIDLSRPGDWQWQMLHMDFASFLEFDDLCRRWKICGQVEH